MNNIEYIYEKTYPYNILRSHKPYTPDFTITQGDKVAYIEHFGITEDGRNNRYTKEQLTLYKKEINDKILLHRQHDTDLIYTFSAYNDGRDLLVHLHDELILHGFELNKRPSKEIFEKIVSTEENKYIARLVKLVCTFIQNFKTNDFTTEDFSRFRSTSSNERTKLFLTICEQCFLEYTLANKKFPKEMLTALNEINEVNEFMDNALSVVNFNEKDTQAILELDDTLARLKEFERLFAKENEIAKIERKIS
jgi:DNA helicase-4